jgi:arsenate reductase
MAEGLLRHLYGDKYDVFSAGTNPTQVHPLAIKVMAEIGIDISKQYSKGIEKFSETDFDVAISVCQSSAKTVCALCSSPSIRGRPKIITESLHKTKTYIDHGFSDPSEVEGTEDEKLEAFRRIRDEIKKWLTEEFGESKQKD